MPKVKITQLSKKQITYLEIQSWEIWTQKVSRFEWYYDNKEYCLIIEGEATVHTDEGDFTFKEGDFVTFEKGLKCVWEIKKAIKKYYDFE